jgi:hypothetical protein
MNPDRVFAEPLIDLGADNAAFANFHAAQQRRAREWAPEAAGLLRKAPTA